ncbi:MAG: hypothetical protein WBL97_05535, partial [Candidatus Sulfotelmatobacter sp.]
VTAEAAGSSPVVPAILLNGLRINRTCWLIHNRSTEPVLRSDFVVVIALGVCESAPVPQVARILSHHSQLD